MTKRAKKPTVDEFMFTHRSELEEDEDFILLKHLAQQERPGTWGQSAGAWLAPGPERDVWLKAETAAEMAHPGWRRKRELTRELRKYWLVRLLRAAKDEGSPDVFRDLLEGWLIRLGVEAPEGVFIPLRGSPGRPRNSSTSEIYEAWMTQEDTSDFAHLAFIVFGRAYTGVDAKSRRNLRERCRQAVKRHQVRLQRNLPHD